MTLGAADIWIDGIDVGHIKGDVTFSCERKYVEFKPANELSPAKYFITSEGFKITCTAAELRLANLRLAMGVTNEITSSYTPSGLSPSLSFDPGTGKWDSMKLGDSKTINDFTVKLEHTRPNGNKVIVVFYKAQCLSNIDYSFKEEEISMQTMEFQALSDSTRSAGDRVGVMYEQVS